MFLRALTSALAIVLVVNPPSGASEVRTWTDASGNFQVEATFVALESGAIKLQKQDGRTIRVELERLSQTDREYVREVEQDRMAGDHGGTLIFATTGVGLDPDKAVQNAFSSAIEQTMGVLVEAETVVENDKLIQDKVLTFSRGFVQEYEVLRQWEDNGLNHARIKAKVSVGRLVEKLKAHSIAVKDLPGERMARQVKHDVQSEGDAAEMFRRVMQDFTMQKMLAVTIADGPEVVEKDELQAKLRVQVELTPYTEQWKAFYDSIQPLLSKVATQKTVLSSKMRPAPGFRKFQIPREQWPKYDRIDGPGRRIFLLQRMNATGSQTFWEVFMVPKVDRRRGYCRIHADRVERSSR